MKKRIMMWFAVVIIAVGVAFAASRSVPNPKNTSVPNINDQSSVHAGGGQLPDYSDTRVLLGDNHNVFVGRVMQKIGDEPYPGINAPTTQFSVKVIVNVKGFLQDTIVVGDMKGLLPIVQPGSTYLFATRYSEATGWYTFGYTNTAELVSDDSKLGYVELKALAEKNERVVAARKAYPDELLRRTDVERSTAFNSYASRHYDATGRLIDDTVVLHEQYMAAHPLAASEPASDAPAVNTPTSEPSASVSPPTSPELTAAPEPKLEPSATPSETTVPSDLAPTPSI